MRRLACRRDPRAAQDAVVGSFCAAIAAGDITRATGLLAPAAVAVTDAPAGPADAPVVGSSDIGRLLEAVVASLRPDQVEEGSVNGRRGVVISRAGRVTAVICVGVRRGRVTEVWVIRDPARLASWNPSQ